MPLQGVMAGTAAALLFASGVAAALAASAPTSTSTSVTTTATAATTTEATTTAPAPTTTTAPPTTASTSTQSTTTTTGAAVTSTSTPTAATPRHKLALAQACPVGGVVVLRPSRGASVVGAVANARTHAARVDGLVYPTDGSIITASSVQLVERGCTAGRPTSGEAQLQDVSVFGRTITASAVTLKLGNSDSASVAGLAIDGTPVSPSKTSHIALHSWGNIVAGSQAPVEVPDGGEAIAALTIQLLQTHAGLPAGTTVLIAVAGLRQRSAIRATKAQKSVRAAAHERGTRTHAAAQSPRKRTRSVMPRSTKPTHEPLTVTPRLGQSHFIFPVVGPSDYVDTYGAFRSDVPGNWHHGDDIFAPLGTPLVAVADGTINRVGWERLGGWRLWVRDDAGDEFYYAHLSGYAPTDLNSDHVKAGEVMGFIGNTGDAFTTSPHLHFEIHPRQLLHLGYDGAVDPTTYLNGWTHLEHVDAPRPSHPPLPGQPLLRKEARYVFRELLAARHLTTRAPKPSQRPRVPLPVGANGAPTVAPGPTREAAPTTRTRSEPSTVTVALLAALGALALVGATVTWTPLRQRLKRSRPAAAATDTAPPRETER